jgi:DNA modification methylase
MKGLSHLKKNDIVYKKTGKVFNQHTYWTKQPVSAIESFIEKHTLPGDSVLDPFCGSGMTGIAASKLNRNVYLSDNSPAAIHISEGYLQKISFEKKILDDFLNSIKKDLNKIYYTNASSNIYKDKFLFDVIGEYFVDAKGKEFSEAKEIFLSIKEGTNYKQKVDKNYEFCGYRPIYRFFVDHKTKKKQYVEFNSKFQSNDDKQILEIKKRISNIEVPDTALFGKEPKRNFKKGIKNVSDLYSRRNLYCLIYIRHKINKLKNHDLKQFLFFCFSSIVFNCSLMSRYRKYENTSIRMGTFYIPKVIKDNNVIAAFEKKVLSIYKAKRMSDIDRCNSTKIKIKEGDATNLKEIKSSSIDFIYTDPPYGDVINYSELNVVFESWLNIHKKYNNEMIINEEFGQSAEDYFSMFKTFLIESSRVLKRNKYMVLIFHHPEVSLWAGVQNCIFSSQFSIRKSTYPVRLFSESKTASQLSTNKRTQGFLALELFNTKKNNNKKLKLLKDRDIENLIAKSKKEGYTSKSDIYDFFINNAIQEFDLSSNKDLSEILG